MERRVTLCLALLRRFVFMEANEILDLLNDVPLLAFQLVIIERINTALLDFIVLLLRITTSLERNIHKLLINTG